MRKCLEEQHRITQEKPTWKKEMDFRERGATEEYLDARKKCVPSVKSLPGSDIVAELDRFSSRLDSMERTQGAWSVQ